MLFDKRLMYLARQAQTDLLLTIAADGLNHIAGQIQQALTMSFEALGQLLLQGMCGALMSTL